MATFNLTKFAQNNPNKTNEEILLKVLDVMCIRPVMSGQEVLEYDVGAGEWVVRSSSPFMIDIKFVSSYDAARYIARKVPGFTSAFATYA